MGDLVWKHNARLLSTQLQSDCKIVSSLREYHVHRRIICRYGQHFKNQFSDDLTNTVSGVIDMTDEDPVALHAMIEWMYVQDYVSLHPETFTHLKQVEVIGRFDNDFLERDHEENKPRFDPIYQNDTRKYVPWLAKHVDVWNLGTKYDIPGLCSAAYNKFAESFGTQASVTPGTIDATWKAYTARADDELDLRTVVNSFFLRRQDLLDDPSLADVMTGTELGLFLTRNLFGAHVQ